MKTNYQTLIELYERFNRTLDFSKPMDAATQLEKIEHVSKLLRLLCTEGG